MKWKVDKVILNQNEYYACDKAVFVQVPTKVSGCVLAFSFIPFKNRLLSIYFCNSWILENDQNNIIMQEHVKQLWYLTKWYSVVTEPQHIEKDSKSDYKGS